MSQPSNVDPREVDKFDRVAQMWWDPDGKMGMLHAINPLRSRFVFDHADVRGARVVDVGCGGGILTETLAAAGASVVGMDQSELTLAVARRHAARSGLAIDYRLQTVEQLAAREAGTFDVVTCLEMLEHVPDPAAVVAACARLLKPGGHAIFSTINRTAKAWLFAIVVGEYVLRILPRGTHEYARLIQPAELAQWTRQAGLDAVEFKGLGYQPLTRRYSLSEDTSVNYMLACRKA